MKSGGTMHPTVLLMNLFNMVIYISAYYFFIKVQVPLLMQKKKYILLGLSLLFTSGILYLFWRVVGYYYFDECLYGHKQKFMRGAGYLQNAIQFYSPTILLYLWHQYDDRLEEQARLHQLEKEKLETELKFLKAQINPHFLFNTLNNLYSFVVTKSEKAPDMILRLSGMLDYILYKSQQSRVALKEELTSIENFIALEKIRYGDRLEVDCQINGDLSVPISPLILLSTVENAFKHGASGDIDEPVIKIDIVSEDDTIECKVWNTKSKFQGEINDEYKEGIGLSNIKRQLNLTYPDLHTIEIFENESSFCIIIKITSIDE